MRIWDTQEVRPEIRSNSAERGSREVRISLGCPDVGTPISRDQPPSDPALLYRVCRIDRDEPPRWDERCPCVAEKVERPGVIKMVQHSHGEDDVEGGARR